MAQQQPSSRNLHPLRIMLPRIVIIRSTIRQNSFHLLLLVRHWKLQITRLAREWLHAEIRVRERLIRNTIRFALSLKCCVQPVSDLCGGDSLGRVQGQHPQQQVQIRRGAAAARRTGAKQRRQTHGRALLELHVRGQQTSVRPGQVGRCAQHVEYFAQLLQVRVTYLAEERKHVS